MRGERRVGGLLRAALLWCAVKVLGKRKKTMSAVMVSTPARRVTSDCDGSDEVDVAEPPRFGGKEISSIWV